MKNAVCIVGSPNRDGSTARLVAEVARGLTDAGVAVTTFHLGEMCINYCRGCKACAATGKCVQYDDMDIIIEAMMKADIVCIGSPSYWGDVTAQLKTFFDRCTPLCDTNMGGSTVPAGKAGISIAVRAGRSSAESAGIIDSIEHFYSHLGIKPASAIHFEGIGTTDDLIKHEGALATAYQAGRNILDYGLSSRATYSLSVAAARDADVLAEMNQALLEEEGSDNSMSLPKLKKRMLRMLAGDYCGVLVWVWGKVAGYFLYKPEMRRRDGKMGFYLTQYYIKPEYRVQNLGQITLQRIMNICFRDGEYISLDVLESSPIGKTFWTKADCKPEHIRMNKPIPLFSDDDPTQIIGWEQKRTEMQGGKASVHRNIIFRWLQSKRL